MASYVRKKKRLRWTKNAEEDSTFLRALKRCFLRCLPCAVAPVQTEQHETTPFKDIKQVKNFQLANTSCAYPVHLVNLQVIASEILTNFLVFPVVSSYFPLRCCFLSTNNIEGMDANRRCLENTCEVEGAADAVTPSCEHLVESHPFNSKYEDKMPSFISTSIMDFYEKRTKEEKKFSGWCRMFSKKRKKKQPKRKLKMEPYVSVLTIQPVPGNVFHVRKRIFLPVRTATVKYKSPKGILKNNSQSHVTFKNVGTSKPGASLIHIYGNENSTKRRQSVSLQKQFPDIDFSLDDDPPRQRRDQYRTWNPQDYRRQYVYQPAPQPPRTQQQYAYPKPAYARRDTFDIYNPTIRVKRNISHADRYGTEGNRQRQRAQTATPTQYPRYNTQYYRPNQYGVQDQSRNYRYTVTRKTMGEYDNSRQVAPQYARQIMLLNQIDDDILNDTTSEETLANEIYDEEVQCANSKKMEDDSLNERKEKSTQNIKTCTYSFAVKTPPCSKCIQSENRTCICFETGLGCCTSCAGTTSSRLVDFPHRDYISQHMCLSSSARRSNILYNKKEIQENVMSTLLYDCNFPPRKHHYFLYYMFVVSKKSFQDRAIQTGMSSKQAVISKTLFAFSKLVAAPQMISKATWIDALNHSCGDTPDKFSWLLYQELAFPRVLQVMTMHTFRRIIPRCLGLSYIPQHLTFSESINEREMLLFVKRLIEGILPDFIQDRRLTSNTNELTLQQRKSKRVSFSDDIVSSFGTINDQQSTLPWQDSGDKQKPPQTVFLLKEKRQDSLESSASSSAVRELTTSSCEKIKTIMDSKVRPLNEDDQDITVKVIKRRIREESSDLVLDPPPALHKLSSTNMIVAIQRSKDLEMSSEIQASQKELEVPERFSEEEIPKSVDYDRTLLENLKRKNRYVFDIIATRDEDKSTSKESAKSGSSLLKYTYSTATQTANFTCCPTIIVNLVPGLYTDSTPPQCSGTCTGKHCYHNEPYPKAVEGPNLTRTDHSSLITITSTDQQPTQVKDYSCMCSGIEGDRIRKELDELRREIAKLQPISDSRNQSKLEQASGFKMTCSQSTSTDSRESINIDVIRDRYTQYREKQSCFLPVHIINRLQSQFQLSTHSSNTSSGQLSLYSVQQQLRDIEGMLLQASSQQTASKVEQGTQWQPMPEKPYGSMLPNNLTFQRYIKNKQCSLPVEHLTPSSSSTSPFDGNMERRRQAFKPISKGSTIKRKSVASKSTSVTRLVGPKFGPLKNSAIGNLTIEAQGWQVKGPNKRMYKNNCATSSMRNECSFSSRGLSTSNMPSRVDRATEKSKFNNISIATTSHHPIASSIGRPKTGVTMVPVLMEPFRQEKRKAKKADLSGDEDYEADSESDVPRKRKPKKVVRLPEDCPRSILKKAIISPRRGDNPEQTCEVKPRSRPFVNSVLFSKLLSCKVYAHRSSFGKR